MTAVHRIPRTSLISMRRQPSDCPMEILRPLPFLNLFMPPTPARQGRFVGLRFLSLLSSFTPITPTSRVARLRRGLLWPVLISGAVLLAACGGGGGGGGGGGAGGGGGSGTARTPTDLVISEVGSCYYYNVDCWFEVYNPTASAVNLSGYDLRSTSINSSSGGSVTSYNFTLPSFTVPAGGYVLISGNVDNTVQRGTQMVRVSSGGRVPFWTSSGFIELVKNYSTVDFVRFGSSSQTPMSSGQWSGASADSLPNASSTYGNSLVRRYPISTDSDSASDWTSVSWATPAGRNDVGDSADADGDGIPDTAEVSGGTYGGLDLYAMGARTGQKDIFIEVDQMNSTDPGVIPRKEALQKVVDAFAAKSISVHFDAGTAYTGSFSTADFNLGQGSSVVAFEQCVTFDQTTCNLNTSNRRSIYDYKAEFMDLRRRAVFHYLLLANTQLANGADTGPSGVAELVGNDLIVSLGAGIFTSTAPGQALNLLINSQASTIMHELGHNLGLRHGGNVDTNYKPNYWSVMNYLYTFYGLDGNPAGPTAYQRWRLDEGDGTIDGSNTSICSLANSPCGAPTQFIMDYSDGSGTALNEANLNESANVGRGSTGGAFADWNLNGSATTGVSRNLNSSGDSVITILTDHNDWGNLQLPFARSYASNSGLSIVKSTNAMVTNPITADQQPIVQEPPPSMYFLQELRNVQ